MPKVSVIVPVYGVEQYIERCARSLFEQTLDDIEYLFVDDCTPDKSIDILKQILEEYPNRKSQVIIHRMEQNSGQAKVREWGMRNATGDYIIHCDSDDWVDVSLYGMMYSSAISEGSDLVVADVRYHDGFATTQTLIGCRNTDRNSFINDLLFQNATWSLWNKLFKSSLYNSITVFPTDNMGEDMAFVMQMVIDCNRISCVRDAYYYYYRNTSSICRTASTEMIISRCQQYHRNFYIVESLFKNKQMDKEFRQGLNWVKYSIKSMLYVRDEKCRDLRKQLYPGIQYKVLFYPHLNKDRRICCIKNIIKHLINY